MNEPSSIRFDDLSRDEQRLLEAAAKARSNAYAPYSNYAVGCAVKAASGNVYTGANVENASYGLSICAEVSAVVSACSAGERELTTIAVVGGPTSDAFDHATAPPSCPCGRCRQLIGEFSSRSGPDPVVIASNVGFARVVRATTRELLPFAFGPANLGA